MEINEADFDQSFAINSKAAFFCICPPMPLPWDVMATPRTFPFRLINDTVPERVGIAMLIVRTAALLTLVATLGCATLPSYIPPQETLLLDQGWTSGERDVFAHTSQGTRILPRSWFLALEQPGLSLVGASRFAAPDYLGRFGFIPDTPSPANPDGLPVGFATDVLRPDDGALETQRIVGLSCAACHTGRIEYKTHAVRIEGGPAMVDISTFQSQLGLALYITFNSDVRFARFAARVLAMEGTPETESTRAELKQRLGAGIAHGAADAEEAKAAKLYPVAEGFGRLDALGRGGNVVFAAGQHDGRNLAVADGPVSFPALWDAPWFDWAQYNGSIRQPLSRNVAESLGVGAVATLTGTAARFTSSVRVDAIARMERLLAGGQPGAGLRPPRWPEAIFGPIDRPAAARGELHYAALCAACHDARLTAVPVGADGPASPARQEIAIKMIPVSRIGTDAKAAINFAGRRVYVALGSSQTVSAAQGLQDVTDHIVEQWFDRNDVPKAARAETRGSLLNEWRDPLAYRARPLQGIWATAPYLHNGSVPSLYQMLLPAAQRDPAFFTGSRQFDPKAVGFETGPFDGGFSFDTTIPGNLNVGHSFGGPAAAPGVIGPELGDTQRWELVEYLKTL